MRFTCRIANLVALFCGLLAAAPVDRISTIDRGQTATLKNQVHPAAIASNDRGNVDPAMPMDHMMLIVRPSAVQEADLEQLLADQQNPSSQNYRKWLTPEEFAGRFGLSPGDNSKVVAWLKGEGFTVNDIARGRNWVAFSGTAGQVSRSLHTSIHYFEVNGEKHFANITDPQVPAALAGIAGGIHGLHDFNPKRMKARTSPAPAPDYTSSTGSHILTPEDYATIYDITPLYKSGFDGSGQAIAVIETGVVSLDDYHLFRNTFGLPSNDPILVPWSSPTYSIDGEGTLDVEWAGAVAPRAQMYYVYGPNSLTSLTYAVNNNLAPIISDSYYSCEGNASPPFYESVLRQANAQGITVLAASGDGGGADCFDQFGYFATHGPLLQFPGAVPEVTAVGGTMFVEGSSPSTYWSSTNSDNLGSALSYIPERVWNESVNGSIIAASGGGPSTVYPKPAWQQGPGVPNDSARDVPDIALTSAGHDPYYVAQGGRLISTYGTSAAAPSMAGIIALLGQYQVAKGYLKKGSGLGNINPQLYRLAQAAPKAFHDIVDGDNKVPCVQGSPGCVSGSYGYSAGPGYDMCTGLGSVDAYNFVTQFNMAANPVTLTLTTNLPVTSPTTTPRATLNDTIQFSATVAAVTNGAGVPTGTVSFSSSADVPLGSGTLDANGMTSISVPGWMLGSAGTGTYAIYAQYSGDVGFSGAGARVLVTLVAPTGASAIIPTVAGNPVYPTTDVQGMVWQETVRIREAGGVPSILSGFTIDGVDQPLAQYFPSAEIPASTTISSLPINFRNVSFPVTKTFGFTGLDLNGNSWSVQTTALFMGPLVTTAGATALLTPLTMVQDTSAGPSCQWSQQLFLDETNGYSTAISSLTLGANNISTQTPLLFGTNRLFAWNEISGTLCWSAATPGTSTSMSIALTDGQSINLQVTFDGPPANPVKMTAAPATISMTAPDANTQATGSLAFTISDASQPWTASVFPANRATSWLTVSQLSGTGNAKINLQATGSGFEPGVYRATIVFQSPNAIPSTVRVPVMFVLGSGTITGDTVITGVVNAASQAAKVSPGMLAFINGSNLANSTVNRPTTNAYPFSLSTAGVSVKVNGISAPILSVSPSQLMVMIPYEAGGGPAVIGVNNNGQVAGYALQIVPVAPGIFTDSSGFVSGQGNAVLGGKLTLTLTGDGDVNSTIPDGFTPAGTANTPSTIKARQPISVTIGGSGVFISNYGLQSLAYGTTMVQAVLPGWIPTGVQPVVVTVNGVDSPPAMLNVSTQ